MKPPSGEFFYKEFDRVETNPTYYKTDTAEDAILIGPIFQLVPLASFVSPVISLVYRHLR